MTSPVGLQLTTEDALAPATPSQAVPFTAFSSLERDILFLAWQRSDDLAPHHSQIRMLVSDFLNAGRVTSGRVPSTFFPWQRRRVLKALEAHVHDEVSRQRTRHLLRMTPRAELAACERNRKALIEALARCESDGILATARAAGLDKSFEARIEALLVEGLREERMRAMLPKLPLWLGLAGGVVIITVVWQRSSDMTLGDAALGWWSFFRSFFSK